MNPHRDAASCLCDADAERHEGDSREREYRHHVLVDVHEGTVLTALIAEMKTVDANPFRCRCT